jgi:hypothetical protein
MHDTPTSAFNASPKPRFNISSILAEITTNEAVASFLFAKEQLPPTAITSAMLEQCMGMDSLAVVASEMNPHILKRFRLESGSSSSSSSSDMSVTEKEKLVFLCHSVGTDYCFASNTEERNPVALIEKPAPLVKGVNRSIGMKLKCGPPGSFAAITCQWLEDGRSNLIVLCYSFLPETYTEKHFLLFSPYPAYRYPKLVDVLESMVCMEQNACQFCIARGLFRCECASPIASRMIPSLPSRNQCDPWTLYKWCWSQYECTMRQYHCILRNHWHSVEIATPAFHIVNPMKGDDGVYKESLQFYANAIRPYYESQLASTRNPCLLICEDENSSETKVDRETLAEDVKEPCGTSSFCLETPVLVVAPEKEGLVGFSDAKNDDQDMFPRLEVSDSDGLARSSLHEQRIWFDAPTNADVRSALQSSGNDRSFTSSMLAMLPAITSIGSGEASSNVLSTQNLDFGSHEMSLNADIPNTIPNRRNESSVFEEDRIRFESYMAEIDDETWPADTRKACRYCPHQSFTRKHDLKRHVRSHHLVERGFACVHCGETFVRKTHLDIHVRGVHEKSSVFPCEICGKQYTYYSTRSKHMRLAHGIRKRGRPDEENGE